ncbi:metallophosphoesterase [uncultured Polaribacter sp.]|uniref:metallophosphoesterase n=1 Tax=uncultured Polaribacter sp. TaxID=174711 RepID=UPI002624F24F|nr:metallophosphoesterase [uncultured Polaribacter sp.]
MKRRKFIKKSVLGIAGIGLSTAIYSWQIEPFWLEFVHKKMPIKNLPNNLIGKTLMQISDTHVGNRFDYQFIIDSFKKAKQLKPDFVVYTGDYVSYENEKQFAQLKEVMQSAVLGNLGTFGILGNHDYGINWYQQKVANQITSILENSKIKILNNQKEEVNGLHIIGLDDYWGLNFNPKKVLSEINHNHANLVLCHNPDVCDLDVWSNYKGWVLSGHTHGGQVKPPFLNPPLLPVENKKYTAGKFNLSDGKTLYINRALGNSRQVRFNVRPEITVFKLEKV